MRMLVSFALIGLFWSGAASAQDSYPHDVMCYSYGEGGKLAYSDYVVISSRDDFQAFKNAAQSAFAPVVGDYEALQGYCMSRNGPKDSVELSILEDIKSHGTLVKVSGRSPANTLAAKVEEKRQQFTRSAITARTSPSPKRPYRCLKGGRGSQAECYDPPRK